jgi:hypothetical protein
MRLGTWNVRSLYRSGSFTTAREWVRYKLDLMDVQEVRWDKWGTVRKGDCNFSGEKKVISSNGNRIFVHYGIVSAVKREEFVSDRMSYIVLRGGCFECACTK